MPKARKSLTTYVASLPGRRAGIPCWACNIPEAEEINKGRLAGLSLGKIRRWLIDECGYPPEEARAGRLNGHFSAERHHERSAR